MRKAPARDASWGFLVAATWKLASVVGDAKKAKGFAQQRTGAFLLTLGDTAVRRAKRRQSAIIKTPNQRPGAVDLLRCVLQQIIRRHPGALTP